MAAHLTDRRPELSADELIGALVPPPRFDAVRFGTYLPDPGEPSQAVCENRSQCLPRRRFATPFAT